jgi:tetratricopeptide (TPR) repeat protein
MRQDAGMASLLDRLERELHAARTARPADAARYAAVLEQAVQACRTNPAAAEVFEPTDLYLELTTAYEQEGRYDDALTAVDAVIAAGVKMRPDSRCLRAETLMRAGRVDEAEPIWTAVLADTPDDVWLYNNAGLEYADVGEHAVALHWLTEGLRLALRTGDPERLIGQLVDLRQASLDNLDQPADELQEQAAANLRDKEQARPTRPTHEGEPAEELTGPLGQVTLAWLPAGDYEQAVQQWPELAGSELVAGPGGPLPHSQYCWALQHQLVGFAEAGIARLAIAPVRVAPFIAWCAERDQEPDSAAARAGYAAQLAAADEPTVIPWPPGRNQPCWCGSGRKYKKCCAAPSSVDLEPRS